MLDIVSVLRLMLPSLSVFLCLRSSGMKRSSTCSCSHLLFYSNTLSNSCRQRIRPESSLFQFLCQRFAFWSLD